MQDKILSIVVPTYNGEEFLSDTLNSFVSQGMNDKVEIVLCDDASTDRTFEIATDYSKLYNNIKAVRNQVTLGMDRNFEKVVSHATGEYIWFCGQDDVFEQGAIEKLLNVIQMNNAIDFIYVNYSQYNHDLSEVITNKMLCIDNDVLCKDTKTFLAITDGPIFLPSFLPSFVLRKSLWDKIDKKTFYGTHYIQLGVFLSFYGLTIYVIAYPYVKGRIPDNGWHKNRHKLVDILSGNLELVTYFYRNNSILIDEHVYKVYFKYYWKIILYNLFMLRLEGIPLNKKIRGRLYSILRLRQTLLVIFIFNVPLGVLRFIRKLVIKWREIKLVPPSDVSRIKT